MAPQLPAAKRIIRGIPCEIRGGCVVRHVFAADLYSICLRGPNGESINDDLLLALIGVKTRTIQRTLDPPPHALRLFDPTADAGRHNTKGPGPCPIARRAAELAVNRALSISIRIPVAGRGWLDSLGPGARVYGDLFLEFDIEPKPVSMAQYLLHQSHVAA